jgi:hypothetical protein
MSRKRTGCAIWDSKKDTWVALLTVGQKGSASRVPVPMVGLEPHGECPCTPKAPCDVRARAIAVAATYARRAVARGAVSAVSVETASEYFDRWSTSRVEEVDRTAPRYEADHRRHYARS